MTSTVTVKLGPDVIARVDAAAKREGCSRNTWLVFAIGTALGMERGYRDTADLRIRVEELERQLADLDEHGPATGRQ